jgi:hypothetical protein
MFTPPSSNMNFPAPLAVMAFLAAAAGLFLALAAATIAWFARKPKLARACLLVLGAGATLYATLLFTFSLASRPQILTRTQEKYFCEIDCHLAYSLLDVKTEDVKTEPAAAPTHYLITIRTRFDETTTSPPPPKDAPLTPGPRTILLIDDSSGRQYRPVATQGTPLATPLKPSDSYTTELAFEIPPAASKKNLRLLITTTPAWPDRVVIGDENSLLHHKTYFAL